MGVCCAKRISYYRQRHTHTDEKSEATATCKSIIKYDYVWKRDVLACGTCKYFSSVNPWNMSGYSDERRGRKRSKVAMTSCLCAMINSKIIELNCLRSNKSPKYCYWIFNFACCNRNLQLSIQHSSAIYAVNAIGAPMLSKAFTLSVKEGRVLIKQNRISQIHHFHISGWPSPHENVI